MRLPVVMVPPRDGAVVRGLPPQSSATLLCRPLDPECPICHEEFVALAAVTRMPCRHLFHSVGARSRHSLSRLSAVAPAGRCARAGRGRKRPRPGRALGTFKLGPALRVEFTSADRTLLRPNRARLVLIVSPTPHHVFVLPGWALPPQACLEKWLSLRNTCPLCRFVLPDDDSDAAALGDAAISALEERGREEAWRSFFS